MEKNMDKEPLNASEDAKEAAARRDFIRDIIEDDFKTNKHQGRVHTRFPPEPNGYLHIGHAKSICLNFGIAREFGGRCHLRFDDTNPTKEEQEYIDAIEADVRWLGFRWAGLYFASDYFEQMYAWAEKLIGKGKAYVCDCTADRVRELRGTLTEPGVACEHRERMAMIAQGMHPDGPGAGESEPSYASHEAIPAPKARIPEL